MKNLFEQASRQSLRFITAQGTISTEDLWNLSLEQLDDVAKYYYKKVKESEEESFIKESTTANKKLQLQFDVVKHIIDVKLAEREEARAAAERRKKKAQIMELISSKENEALSKKSIDELYKELEELS